MKIETSSDLPSRDFSLKEFQDYLKPFDLISSLMSLQKLGGLMGNQIAVNSYIEFEFHSSPKIKVRAAMLTRDFVSFMAKQVLLNCGKQAASYTDTDLFYLIHVYNNLRIDLHAFKDDQEHKEKGWLWVIRATNHQWFYKRFYSSIIARYHWLFSKVFEIDSSLGAQLNDVLKIDLFDVMKIGTCIYANYCPREDGKFADSFLMTSYTGTSILPLRPLLKEENILKFFDIFSITQDGFKEESKKFELSDELLKKYEFNTLKRYPVIRTDSGEDNKKFIIPSSPDFLYGSFEGLYYVLIDRLDEAGKSLLRKQMGEAFEKYVGEFTRYCGIDSLSSANLIPETSYHVGKDEWKSADWLLRSDKDIFQIECKVRKIDNYSRAGIQTEDGPGIDKLLSDLATELDKLIKKEDHIKRNLVPGVTFKDQKVVNVIVFLDEMFGLNQYARKHIKEKMSQSSDNFYILGIWEYELICQHAKNTKKSLTEAIDDHMNGKTEIYKVDFLDEVYFKFFDNLKDGK